VNTVRNSNGLEEGDASSSLLLQFDPEHAIRKVQANNEGMTVPSTHQLLLHGDKVHLVSDGVHSLLQENTQTYISRSYEVILEVRVKETHCGFVVGVKLSYCQSTWCSQ